MRTKKEIEYLLKAIDAFQKRLIVLSPDYEILAANIPIDELPDTEANGSFCYQYFHDRASPCENCAVMAAEELMGFLEDGNIRNSVNYPDTEMARNGGYRITFCNENVPKVLGHVLSVLADHNINVIDMVNLSRGDFAYSIIDVENQPGPGVMSAIRDSEHVIRARLLVPADS